MIYNPMTWSLIGLLNKIINGELQMIAFCITYEWFLVIFVVICFYYTNRVIKYGK